MRVLSLVAVALSCAVMGEASAAIEADDDPKCARGECRPLTPFPVDEDDPKLARGWHRRWPTAKLQISYRFLMVADPYGGTLPFHLVQLTGFPISRYFRLGISLTGGGSTRYGAGMVDAGLSVGVQYPWRLSPFLDVGIAVGLIGANLVGRSVVSYEFRPNVEAGVDVFVASRFHLTIALGWARPVYGGVDATAIEAAMKSNQTPDYTVRPFSLDTFTVRAGVGF